MMHHQSQPAKVNFSGGDVDNLKEAIKRKLTNLLGTVDAIDITLADTTRKGLLSQIVWWTDPLVSTAQNCLKSLLPEVSNRQGVGRGSTEMSKRGS